MFDAGARSGVGQGPIKYPLLEKLVEKALKPLGQVVPARSRLALVGELDRPVAMALGRRQLDPVLRPEISLEGLGRRHAAFGLLTLFVDKAADEHVSRSLAVIFLTHLPCLPTR